MIALIASLCAFHAGGALPDPVCSPGATFTSVTQRNIDTTICRSGWSAAHRDVTASTRRKVYEFYGLAGPHPFPEWELDHRIPLELGGNNDVRNLWPQHYPGDKDQLENQLHDRVCAHTMRLRTAWRRFRGDWRTWSSGA